MYKHFCTILFTLIFTATLFAQEAAENALKDDYTGPIIKEQIPAGFNIPIPYESTFALLHDNGPLVTHPGGGAGGKDLSAYQPSLGNTTVGFNNNVTANYSMADDFTISDPSWEIEEMQFFTYQTGSDTISTITDLRIQIWDGPPNNSSSTVIWGNLTTNRLTETDWIDCYRSSELAPNLTSRPIFSAKANFSPVISLSTGTYWVQFSLGGTVASGPWVPPVTILGLAGAPNANSLQYSPSVGAWQEVKDGGSQAKQELPFIILGNRVVPVELTSFTAIGSTNQVELSWTTATETNNQGFEIQRNTDGEFHTIAFVQGQGTSTEIHNYSFIDKDLKAGHYSYRLKQIDYNGTFDYSNVVEADVVAPTVFALEQNYPNPFNPSTTINFSLAVDSKVSLKVFNVLGQEVASLVNGQLSAGSQKISFDASSLNSGVYFYRLDADGIDGQKFSSTKKMILTK